MRVWECGSNGKYGSVGILEGETEASRGAVSPRHPLIPIRNL